LVKLGVIYRSLVEQDFRLLEVFVKLLGKFEYVPVEVIASRVKMPPKELDARLRKLTRYKLLEKHPTMNAYRLRFLGLDCVALHRLVRRNVLKALGDRVGVGKESEIYKGIADNGDVVAVKFYRIGRQSFRRVVVTRGYGVTFERGTWVLRSVVAGEREVAALRVLNSSEVPNVPRLYGGALHAVVIEFIDGVELYMVRELADPEGVLEQLIEAIRAAYWKAKIVHGDLSEFNIIVAMSDDKEVPYIIDWPQYVESESPEALRLLERDVRYVVRFFNKRFRLSIDFRDVLEYVLEKPR